MPEHPIGDDVLDVVGHHRQHRADQVRPAVSVLGARRNARRRFRRGKLQPEQRTSGGMLVLVVQAQQVLAVIAAIGRAHERVHVERFRLRVVEEYALAMSNSISRTGECTR